MSKTRFGVIPFVCAVFLTIPGCKKEEVKPAAPAPSAPASQATPAAPAAAPPAAAPDTATTAAAPTPAPSAAPPAVPAPAEGATSAATPAASSGAPATPAAPAARPALATADGENPGSRVEVQEFRRVSGGTLMLKFAMINDAEKPLSFSYAFAQAGTGDFANIGGVHLIDPVGKKKYFVVRDSESKCDCSKGLGDLAAKSRINLWARFPAPPESVDKITVIIPHFAPLDDVPISR